MKKLILTVGMCVVFVVTAFAQVPGDIIITELMPNPAGAEPDSEYVELYNKRSISFDLEGFTIGDDAGSPHTIAGSLVIPAEGFLVLSRVADPLGNGSNVTDYIYDSGVNMRNSGEQIVLKNSKGLQIASSTYQSTSVDGKSRELDAISNVDKEGAVGTSNFDYSTTEIVGGNQVNGSPGAAGNTDLSEVPTLRFTTSTSTVSENVGAVNIEVMLEDADGNTVSVDVVYNEGSSTTVPADFTSTSTATLTFNTAAAGDETKNATFTVTNDTPYDGIESAIFDLSNLTTSGTTVFNAAGDSTYTLKITDTEVPSIVINEVNKDPGQDSDGNGTLSTADDEYIEIYNNENVAVDIGGWYITESSTLHTFDSETTIKAKSAIVIFDDSADPTGDFGGSTVLVGDGHFGLTNGGSTVILLDSNDSKIDSLKWDSGTFGDKESITRNPDGTGTFVEHTDANASLPSSPGTRVDGSPFSSRNEITGTAGWRLISSPVTATIDDILGKVWTQGFTGADTEGGSSNVFTYDETVQGDLGNGYTSAGNQSDNLTQAKGYAVYVYEDDDVDISGTQGGFPKTITYVGSSPIADVGPISFTHTASETPSEPNDGWNLVGNPFAKRLDVNQLGFNNNADLNKFAYVYRGGSYSALDADDSITDADTIGIGEGFFVKTTAATTYTFAYATVTAKQALDNMRMLNFTFAGQGKEVHANIRFKEGAEFGLDANDAYYLGSFNESYIGLFSKENEVAVQVNSYPYNLEQQIDIPLDVEVSDNGTYTLNWDDVVNIPSSWSVTLIDKVTNTEYDLSTPKSIEIEIEGKSKINPSAQNNALALPTPKAKTAPANERFTIVVVPSTSVSKEDELDKVTEFSLEQNYPNPFNPSTSIKYSVGKTGPVSITVYNVMGQKVAEILNTTQTAGAYQLTWDAAAQASGIYYYRLTAPGQVITRQMTLIK